MIPLHPHKGMIKINLKVKITIVIKFRRRAMIKGEMRIMGIMKKGTQERNHHIQECAIMLKEITP
jgi:hypothetical protein